MPIWPVTKICSCLSVPSLNYQSSDWCLPEELRCKYSLHLRKNICTPNPKTTNVLCIILCYAHFNVLQYIPYCNILPFVNTQHESCGSLRLGSYLFTLFLHYGAQVVFTHHLAILGLLRRLYWLPSEVGVQAHGRRRPAALLLFFQLGDGQVFHVGVVAALAKHVATGQTIPAGGYRYPASTLEKK